MRLVLFLFLIVGCWCDVKVLIDQNGGYNITVDNQIWLRSARTAIYVDNRWYSTEDNSLPLTNISTAQGNDPNLGSWNETILTYNLTRNQSSTPVVARIRQWNIVSAFTFHLETGDRALTDRLPLDMEQVRTVFPSFYIEKMSMDDQRGYFTFSGAMTGEGDKHAGLWNASSKVITSGMQGGPVVLFNLTQQGEEDLLVLSPFSHFMATSLNQRNKMLTSALEYGVLGSMSSVPANYTHTMIVFYSQSGINEGIHEWGQTMQQAFNRTDVNRVNDLTINYLGYYTDNGGYYYYNTEPDMNYEETIVDVTHKIKLPFHYIQLDSWWYFKGIGNGVTEWTSRSDIFPDGLIALHRRLENIPLAAHNRFWAYDTVYKQKYAFVLDAANGKALPFGNDSFWIDLFTGASNWGLVLYEQDWLNVQTIDFLPTRTDINLGEQWLMSMGAAAEQFGINIQYCMSLPRHILQALQIPRVTHARASDDYATHLENQKKSQWNIGISSMLADAVGLAPFKDVLWSTSVQPGSPYGSSSKEILPDREILIATLSTGPVGPGDGIDYVNIESIMKCCRQDGLILKPDRPITTINTLIADWASNNGVVQGELYSTQTMIIDRTFHIIFASAMKRDYTIYPSMIGSEGGIIWSYDNAQTTSTFDDTHPLDVLANKCDDLSICLWYVSPLWQFNGPMRTKYALLGEWGKWTAVSQQRFTSITTNKEKTQATITVQGVASEIVPVVIFHSVLHSVTVNCSISTLNGQANVVITPTNVVCS
ncbi:unnamed protein product [Rotaria socialis]|uniref:Uncharacterized protein n=1 Tax=Rotaria socialis TaxID=392032 RepID=A0A818KY99_9BILA|nr:unnamed protein product [Rotaria socialis]CAF4472722.1 unnamed protein product [Rotaria socialis]